MRSLLTMLLACFPVTAWAGTQVMVNTEPCPPPVVQAPCVQTQCVPQVYYQTQYIPMQVPVIYYQQVQTQCVQSCPPVPTPYAMPYAVPYQTSGHTHYDVAYNGYNGHGGGAYHQGFDMPEVPLKVKRLGFFARRKMNKDLDDDWHDDGNYDDDHDYWYHD